MGPEGQDLMQTQENACMHLQCTLGFRGWAIGHGTLYMLQDMLTDWEREGG